MIQFRTLLLFAVILIFLLIYSTIAFSQQIRVKALKSEATVSYSYLEEFNVNLTFNYSLKKHEPFLGVHFPFSSNHATNYGFLAGYKFYPNKLQQSFDLFFIYMMQAHSRYLYSGSTIKGVSWHNLLGYGFDIYFLHSIYLTHKLLAGVEKSWFNDHGNFTDLSLMITLGIGLKIKPRESNK